MAVGMIDSTWGGTPAEAWTRVEALGEDASLNSLFTHWGKMTDEEIIAELSQKDEQRQKDEAKAAGKPEPQFPWHPDLLSYGPGMLWNGMIAPLTPMAIRGVIWYQGETNAGAVSYTHLALSFMSASVALGPRCSSFAIAIQC